MRERINSAKMAEIKNKSKDLEKKLAAKKVKEDIAEVSTKKAAKPTKASSVKAVAKANGHFDVDSFLEETPAVLNITAKTAASKNAPPSKPPVSPSNSQSTTNYRSTHGTKQASI